MGFWLVFQGFSSFCFCELLVFFSFLALYTILREDYFFLGFWQANPRIYFWGSQVLSSGSCCRFFVSGVGGCRKFAGLWVLENAVQKT